MKLSKTNYRIGAVCIIWLLFLAGCGFNTRRATVELPTSTPVQAVPTPAHTATPAQDIEDEASLVALPVLLPLEADDIIVVTGSGTVFPLLNAVYQRFIRRGFRGRVNLNRIGTGAGFDAWCAPLEEREQVDMVMASRPISAEELATCLDAGRVPIQIAIAHDELTVFVNNQNEFIEQVSLDELSLLFTATSWSDVNPDWPDELIQRYIPSESSGTFDLFVERVFEGDPTLLGIAPNMTRSTNPNALVLAVSSDANGLGFAGRAPVVQNPSAVRSIPLETVPPGGSTGVDHPLARPLFIYFDLYTMRENTSLATFVTFILNYVNLEVGTVGYFPVRQDLFDASRQRFLESWRGDVRISGSTTVFGIAVAARERMQQDGYDGFVEVEGIGSSSGIEEFCETLENDVAIASRDMRDSEEEICTANGRPPIEFRLATDAFTIAVNEENTFLEDVTNEDFIAIYSAERWSDVNPAWPDEEIVHYMVGSDTGGFDVLVDEIYDGDEEGPLGGGPDITQIYTGIEMADVIANDRNAIGILALPFYLQFSDVLRGVPLNGVEPTPETVEDGSYPLARPLFAYVDAQTIRQRPQVAAYLHVLLSNLDTLTVDAGFFAPSERLYDANIDQLITALSKPELEPAEIE